MSQAIKRSLSPAPGILVALGVLLVLIAERLIGSGTARIVVDVLAGLLLVTGAGLRVLWLRGLDSDARKLALLQLATYGGLSAGLGCYAAQLALTDPAATEARAPIVLMILGLILIAVGLGAMLALELTAMRMRPAGFVEWRRVRDAWSTGVSLTLAIAALFLLNFAADQKSWRHDASFAAPTSPSEATLGLVQSLEDPVEIFLFYPRGNRLMAEIEDYFDAIGRAGAKIQVLHQAADPELARELKVTGNGNIALRLGERTAKWFLGTDLDSARSRLKKLDSELRTHLAKVAVKQRTVFFTSGHGERGSAKAAKGEAPAGKVLRAQLKTFNAKDRALGLADGLGSAVNPEADLVVVFGPTEPLSEPEVASLRAYSNSGKPMLIMLDPDTDHGLQPLLEDLGLTVSPGTVCDDKVFYPATRTPADHTFLVTNAYANHPSVKTLSRERDRAPVLFMRAGHLSAVESHSAKHNFIVRSMPKSFADIDGNYQLSTEGEARGQLQLAAAVERTVEGQEQAGRTVVIADADVLADMLVGNQPNLVLGYELLGWLLGDDALGGEVAVEEDVPIRHTRAQDVLWFHGTIAGAPLLVLGAGLSFVYLKRRRRRAP